MTMPHRGTVSTDGERGQGLRIAHPPTQNAENPALP